MKVKQNPEGVKIENEINDESTIAKKLLKKCKDAERSQRLIPISLGKKTLFLVPEGTDVDKWKKKKLEDLNRRRNSDLQ